MSLSHPFNLIRWIVQTSELFFQYSHRKFYTFQLTDIQVYIQIRCFDPFSCYEYTITVEDLFPRLWIQ